MYLVGIYVLNKCTICHWLQDKKQEIDSNESAAIDTEEILVVDEVRAPGTPQVDIHVGPDKVMSESVSVGSTTQMMYSY